jgi:hypothetical protein
VDADEPHPGLHGYCNKKAPRMSIRIGSHRCDRSIRMTHTHETAHAATNAGHEKLWRNEMQRLKDAGAPTEALDFLVPYSARRVVTSFTEAAYVGASWEEALN